VAFSSRLLDRAAPGPTSPKLHTSHIPAPPRICRAVEVAWRERVDGCGWGGAGVEVAGVEVAGRGAARREAVGGGGKGLGEGPRLTGLEERGARPPDAWRGVASKSKDCVAFRHLRRRIAAT